MSGAPAARVQAAPTGGDAEKIPWDALGQRERAVLEQYLASPDWPIRVFGLLRLERYEGAAAETAIRRHVGEDVWPVRCFALRQAQRQGVTIRETDLAGADRQPRVVRAALRCGIELDDELVEGLGRRLLRTRELDALMLGLEIAAASDLPELRAEAEKRAATLIRNMDAGVEALVSRRLAVVLGLTPPPTDVRGWQSRLQSMDGKVRLAGAGERGPGARAARPLVADMEPEPFYRLLDYLDVLRQRDLELAITMDSTWSMIPMLNEVRAGVDSLIFFFNDVSRTMRLAFIAYRDHDNKPVWEGHPFTADVVSIRQFLFRLRNTRGADLPEAVLDGLDACNRLAWTPRATREIILIGDARPHDDDVDSVLEMAQSFRSRGISVHTVHVPMELAPGQLPYLSPAQVEEIRQHTVLTAKTFAEIAKAGGGRNVSLTEPRELVPSVMHVAIEEAWWPVFDEFYELYLEWCR
ncbi:MAG: vWA domain-containing protein [Planctomycetota bacterium]